MAKSKTIDPTSQMIEGLFPGAGLDVSCELGRQPALTSPESVNVRTVDSTNRARGGSRMGLVKFIQDRLNGAADIQHLAVLVTTDPALLAAGVTPPGDIDLFILDPTSGSRNPGRIIQIGGTGVSQNINISNLQNTDPSQDQEGNFIPGQVRVAGVSYTVDILPLGTRTVTDLGPVPVPEGQPVIVIKAQDGTYYMQGGP